MSRSKSMPSLSYPLPNERYTQFGRSGRRSDKGIPGLEYQKEKFIKIDNENFVKEALVIEGGLLDLGFLKYLVRLEIVGDADKTCIIRSTVEYEVEDEHTGNASFITASTFARIAEAITKYIKAH
ncbi:S-norcoclaurine synthase [Triticum urartu]|uniref:S-norcoclaurine synthase n=1 Tax=Triticum urartu TaxID=4572 RepID=M7Z6T6_TRIUA|nr:S-norcoclaurine synthase [Triticum urartu]